MRKAALFRSVRRFLDEDTDLIDAVYLWRRHRLVVPFAVAVFIGMLLIAGWVGWDDWATRIVLGLAATALAVTASTEYRILADTSHGTFLLQASRIRQVAIAMAEQLPSDARIDRVGGTIVASDWEVDGSLYTAPKSSEQAMARIAER